MNRLRPLGGFLWAAVAVALTAALYAGYRSTPEVTWFALREIRVEGNGRTPAAEVVKAAGLATGTGLFSVDVGAVRRSVERLPWVRRARVVRTLPSTITVAVDEWVPVALVRLDRLYYLTGEGHVVRAPLDQGLDFPVVTGPTRAQLAAGPWREALLDALDLLGRRGMDVSEIHVDPDTGLTVYTPENGGTGIRLGFDGFAEKLARLDRLRRHLDRRGRAAYAVNLDYDDKIVARLVPVPVEERKR